MKWNSVPKMIWFDRWYVHNYLIIYTILVCRMETMNISVKWFRRKQTIFVEQINDDDNDDDSNTKNQRLHLKILNRLDSHAHISLIKINTQYQFDPIQFGAREINAHFVQARTARKRTEPVKLDTIYFEGNITKYCH